MLFHNRGGTHYSPAEFNRDRGLSPSATGLAAQIGPAAVRQTKSGVLSGISLIDRLRTGVLSTTSDPVLAPTISTTLTPVTSAYYEPGTRCPVGEEWDTIDNLCRPAQRQVRSMVAIAPPIPIPEGVPAPPVSPRTAAAQAAPAVAEAGAALVQQALQRPPTTIYVPPTPVAPTLVSLLPEEEVGFLDKKIFGKVKVKYALIGGALSIAGIFAVRALR